MSYTIRVGEWEISSFNNSMYPPCASTAFSKHRTRSDRHFPDFQCACARGSMVGNDRLNVPAIDTFSH